MFVPRLQFGATPSRPSSSTPQSPASTQSGVSSIFVKKHGTGGEAGALIAATERLSEKAKGLIKYA